MPRYPARRPAPSLRHRSLRGIAIAVCSGALLATAASAGTEATLSPTRPAVARAGEFCTSASCGPRSARLLTGAAFGATVLAIGWRARRREPRQP